MILTCLYLEFSETYRLCIYDAHAFTIFLELKQLVLSWQLKEIYRWFSVALPFLCFW